MAAAESEESAKLNVVGDENIASDKESDTEGSVVNVNNNIQPEEKEEGDDGWLDILGNGQIKKKVYYYCNKLWRELADLSTIAFNVNEYVVRYCIVLYLYCCIVCCDCLLSGLFLLIILMSLQVLKKGEGADSKPVPSSTVVLRTRGSLDDGHTVDVNDSLKFLLGEGEVLHGKRLTNSVYCVVYCWTCMGIQQ